MSEHRECLGEAFIVFTPKIEWSSDHLLNLFTSLMTGVSASLSPTFIEYKNLLNAHETMEYSIRGLDGGVECFDKSLIEQFSVNRFPTGNMLLSSKLLDSDDENFKRRITHFDLGVIWLLLYEHWRETGTLPKQVFTVSSKWSTSLTYGTVALNQYALAGKPEQLFTDRNLYCAFYRGINSTLSDRMTKWELQQSHYKKDIASMPEYEHAAIEHTVQKLSDEFSQGRFSEQFSMLLYLRHLLRNRPLLLKALSKCHSGIAKVLKL